MNAAEAGVRGVQVSVRGGFQHQENLMRNNSVSISFPREVYIELLNDHIERYGGGRGSHTLELTSYHEAGTPLTELKKMRLLFRLK